MTKIVRVFILIVALAIVLAVGGGYGWLASSLPRVDGELRAPGINEPVTIARDADGVPTITANSWNDAWAGLGFVHAQDRLWQMESLRRFALGRLSAVIGAATVEIDAAQRRLDFERLTATQFTLLSTDTRAALSAYARGVNAFLETHDGALPLEFTVLGFAPGRWAPADGLLWGRLMAYQLSGRWRDDALRSAMVQKLGPERADALWPGITKPTGPAKPGQGAALLTLPAPTHAAPMGASNAWAVAGSKTSGGALLAGDPHLGFSIPGVWYLARIKVGDAVLEGATAPGSPFVIIGRNRHVAWSFTSNEADLQDVRQVRADQVTEEIRDTIVVDGDNAHALIRRYVAGAPVVAGDLLTESGTTGLALRATALQATDTTPDALLGLNRARGLDEAAKALRSFHAPLMNVVMAARDGRIGMVLAGLVPDRLGADGRLPLPASAPMWRLVPGHNVVAPMIDPPVGIVSNANEKLPAFDAAAFDVQGAWPSPARARRLENRLFADADPTRQSMTDLQLDIVDVTFEEWRWLASSLPEGRLETPAKKRLADWDGTMRRGDAAPLIYATWMARLRNAVFADELGADVRLARAYGPLELRAIVDGESPLCDDIRTPEAETCDALPAKAFAAAIRILSEAYGEDIAKWRWGDAHKAQFKHALLGKLPLGDALFDRSIEIDGGDRTLNRGASRSNAGLDGRFDHIHGAGLRAIHDMSGGTSRYMVAPGQSGNPLSPHYSDLLKRWRDGAYIGFDAKPTATLRLMPGN